MIARYEVSLGDPDLADVGSEEILLTITQPDAQPQRRPCSRSARTATCTSAWATAAAAATRRERPGRHGAARQDAAHRRRRGDGAVPRGAADNPDAGDGLPLGLIWSKGLRNPWRFSFDRGTGDLYIGDVGQNAVEEIDVEPAASTGGVNYGWDIFEGTSCFEPDPTPTCPAPPTGFTFPVLEYTHASGLLGHRRLRVPRLRDAGSRRPLLLRRLLHAVRRHVRHVVAARRRAFVDKTGELGAWAQQRQLVRRGCARRALHREPRRHGLAR